MPIIFDYYVDYANKYPYFSIYKTMNMNKTISVFCILMAFGISLVAGNIPVQILSSNSNGLVIKLSNPDYFMKQIETPAGTASKIVLANGVSLMQKGFPDLAKYAFSVNMPGFSEANIEIVSSSFSELENISIAPSKGTISRITDPSSFPYTYDNVYAENTFFPNSIVSTNAPYYIRDKKGQVISLTPFQYNAVTRTLRVFNEVVLKINFKASYKKQPSIDFNSDKEFEAIFAEHFINYTSNNSAGKLSYTPVNEDGDMLVICDNSFSSKITPLVAWKNLKGIKTTLVLKSAITTGAITPALIKSYITNFISSNPNLKYVLIVGDHQQIPASSTSAGPSDNEYTYLAGNDHYPDIFIGRFSAQTATDVEVQVNKVINYEKYPQLNGSFYNTGACIASNQGPGDNNEYDYQHQQIIRAKLQAFTYGTVGEFYDGSQGGADAPGNPTALDLQNFINANGAGVISYTGHGGDFSFVTTGFSNSNIPNLTNTNKLPFIFSVACVNGNFTTNTTCFAEAWLRAGTPAAPKGAIAAIMSTINQYWDEPMAGQDHMIDVLATNTVSVKRSIAGIAMNGCMFMNDQYGASGADMTDTWTVFGDPSLRVTTAPTTPMTVTHPATVNIGSTNTLVNSNENGALICFNVLGNILSTGKIATGNVNMTYPALTTTDTVYVTATAFNKTPYFGKIIVKAVTTGVTESNVNNSMLLYPNPAKNNMTLKLNNYNGSFSYEILNVIGQVVKSSEMKSKSNNTNEVIDIHALQDGTYFLRVKLDSEVKTLKFVIN